MFSRFSRDKNHYEKGQIFPFLLAVLVVILIMAMITVNLGQLGVFKTDTSNAADAGALAGASVLSGALLGLGLKSDSMAGYGLVMLLAIYVMLCKAGEGGIAAAISMYIAAMVSQISDWLIAYGEGKMAWTNAKQTALTYAFNNSGIDEPRPTFKQFLKSYDGIDDPNALKPSQAKSYYEKYFKGEGDDDEDTKDILRHSQSGFSKFIADNQEGFWSEDEFGLVDPGETAPVIVKNGYGWSDKSDGTIINSYSDTDGNEYNYDPDDRKYADEENYVEAEVTGSTMYPIELYYFSDLAGDAPALYALFSVYYAAQLFWLAYSSALVYGPYAALIIAGVAVMIFMMMLNFFPLGLTMSDIDEQTTDNPLSVKVTRYKQDNDLGLWNFQYGKVSAQAKSVAFRESKEVTINPVYFGDAFGDYSFDTSLHLFETKLINAF